MPTQLLVLGMHRSGTSTLAGLLHYLGAYVGKDAELLGANDENPKGFWERKDVVDANDALLQAQEASWYDPLSWQADHPVDAEDKASITRILDSLNSHPVWVMKDPRQSITLPAWLPALDRPYCLLMHRDPLAIAHSLRKRNQLTLAVGLALWEVYMVHLLNAVPRERSLWMSYSALLEDPLGESQRLLSWIDDAHLSLDETAIQTFITPTLQRSTPRPEDTAWLTASQRKLLHYAESQTLPETPLEVSEQAAYLLRQSQELFRFQARHADTKEVLSRAEQTIAEHDLRLESLSRQVSDQQREYQELREQHDALNALRREEQMTHAETLAKLEAAQDALGEAHAELEAIKATRLWRLREKLTS